MKAALRGAAFCALLLTGAAMAQPPGAVSFQRDIVPFFSKNCAYCHMKEAPDAGLILEPRLAYVMIVNVGSAQSSLKRVAPGDPAHSYLVLKMQDRHRSVGGSGQKMPVFPGGVPRGFLTATAADIALVRAWIDAGALNN